MEGRNNGIRSARVLELVQVSLMAAVIFVATSIIHVPSFNGVVHLGDSMVFVAAILLGKRKAAVASAIGMCLFDLVNGYLLWAPYTFIIKALMGYIAGAIALRGENKGTNIIRNTIAFAIAGIWMIGAYYLGGVSQLLLILGEASTLNQALIIAAKDIPGNIAQVVAGIIIAVPLVAVLKRTSVFSKR